jgi:hypothetical protein
MYFQEMSPETKSDVDVEMDKFVFHAVGLANVKTCQECLSKTRQLSLRFLKMITTGSTEFVSLLSSPNMNKERLCNRNTVCVCECVSVRASVCVCVSE